MNIETLISQAAGEAVKALYGMEPTEKMLQLQKTRSEFEGTGGIPLCESCTQES